ncbi:MAG TPA: cyclase family protein [Sphingomicrobium sp.]|nr:cyclase family protein [Sphingomicrobium sp.]
MANRASERLVELSHLIEEGMTTYQGLPEPHLCDFWTREASAANYDDGSTFQIGRIDMVGNTGTYVDSPFHRYAEGKDFTELPLESLANLDGLVVRRPFENGLAVDADAFAGLDVRGKAVLVHTGWDRHWRTEAYFSNNPFLTEAAASLLIDGGAALVGIDSLNIDDTRMRARPIHTLLLGADIPICEHMTGLDQLPDEGFRFTAAPPKIRGMASFPVRAFAVVP